MSRITASPQPGVLPRFRWTPFDTAGGTLAAGIMLTVVLVLMLRWLPL